jgi:hypothetical protein
MAADGRGAAPDGRRRGLGDWLRFVGAALRRFVVLLGVIGGLTLLGSIILGLLFGTTLNRAISLGFYLVGCFLLVSGFFLGNRGPTRLKGEGVPLLGARFVRWASPSEREEALNDSAVFVSIGLALIIAGAAVDDRHRLF